MMEQCLVSRTWWSTRGRHGLVRPGAAGGRRVPVGLGRGLLLAALAGLALAQRSGAQGLAAQPNPLIQSSQSTPSSQDSPQVPRTVQVRGGGATFPAKVYARWMTQFERSHADVHLSYAPVGSGEGERQIGMRQVDFAGSDNAQPWARLQAQQLVQIPMLVGGLVPVVNLPGIHANALVLTAGVLAGVMAAQVRYWDEPAIAQLNPRLRLPHLPVVRLVREEASGSTQTLVRYLGMASSGFALQVPVSGLPKWPQPEHGLLRAKGNDGLVSLLHATPGGVTVVSFDRVLQDHLASVRLRNRQGEDVAASTEAFKLAILASGMSRQGDDSVSLLDLPGSGVWPLTATSYVLLDARPARPVATEWAARFVAWCFTQGDALTQGSGFAPLPSSVQAKLAGRLLSIRDAQGRTLDVLGP